MFAKNLKSYAKTLEVIQAVIKDSIQNTFKSKEIPIWFEAKKHRKTILHVIIATWTVQKEVVLSVCACWWEMDTLWQTFIDYSLY